MPSPQCRILTLLGTYLPGYKAGGPIRSIENLAEALGGEFQFSIVTRDRDLGDKQPFPGIVTNRWVRVGNADVLYLRPGLQGFLSLCALLWSIDRRSVLYLNSFFARRFSILAVLMHSLRLCRPHCIVLAPRGELSPGAMWLKRRRKRLYTRISRWLGVYGGIVWHASSDFEAADIRRQFPLTEQIGIAGVLPGSDITERKRSINAVVVASDLVGLGSPERRNVRSKRPGQLRAVFVSRLSRMKNLSGALEMLEGVLGEVTFNIYGPLEDEQYWRQCQRAIAALPANIRVQYYGEVERERIKRVFADHDLLLLPTLGENFGHVIYEALAAGCPALISDQTPWRNLEAEGVGWAIPIGKREAFQAVLQQCVDGGGEWYAALSTRATNYAAKRASDPEILDANRRLFRRALSWPNPHQPRTNP